MFAKASVVVLAALGLVACSAEGDASSSTDEVIATPASLSLRARVYKAAESKVDWQTTPGGLRVGEIPFSPTLTTRGPNGAPYYVSFDAPDVVNGLSFALEEPIRVGWETAGLLTGKATKDYLIDFACPKEPHLNVVVLKGQTATEIATELAQRVKGSTCRLRIDSVSPEAVWIEGLLTVTPDVEVASMPQPGVPDFVTLKDTNRLVFADASIPGGSTTANLPLRVRGVDNAAHLTCVDDSADQSMMYSWISLAKSELHATPAGGFLRRDGTAPELVLYRPLSPNETRE